MTGDIDEARFGPALARCLRRALAPACALAIAASPFSKVAASKHVEILNTKRSWRSGRIWYQAIDSALGAKRWQG